jgi:DNA repair exonuclease SbcCD ATPase subunit
MLKRLLRGQRPLDPSSERRLEVLEDRLSHLEELLEGLQDAVHRESIRRNEEAAGLQRRMAPREMARALSEDARRRGLA